jgi:hypothetical protein
MKSLLKLAYTTKLEGNASSEYGPKFQLLYNRLANAVEGKTAAEVLDAVLQAAFLDGIRDKYTALYHAMELDETCTLAECIDHVLHSAKRIELNATVPTSTASKKIEKISSTTTAFKCSVHPHSAHTNEMCYSQHSELRKQHRGKTKSKPYGGSGDRTFAAVATSSPSQPNLANIQVPPHGAYPESFYTGYTTFSAKRITDAHIPSVRAAKPKPTEICFNMDSVAPLYKLHGWPSSV